MPSPDRELLASLEQLELGIPTINNMIMGDRVVSKLNYNEGLTYATFLARRLAALFSEIRPSVIIGGFDALHSGIAFAIAKRMNIPWFSLNFSVIPSGMACFCNEMNPASRVILNTPNVSVQRGLAGETLQKFEEKSISAPAYIAPLPAEVWNKVSRLPLRIRAIRQTLRKSGRSNFYRFIEYRSGHSVLAALLVLWRAAAARKALSKIHSIIEPSETPYVFFGLHMQPESSIDVWAPYYSDQIRVIELISRSLPPTHKFLVKIHKSDVSNYSRDQLERIRAFPGVELVAPNADARVFIENAELVVAIQGTIGLEAALLGRPVIMLGDSPVTTFPSASRIGKLHEFPALIKRKLAETAPSKRDIENAFSSYLAPFFPATHNDWTKTPSEKNIENFVDLFDGLRRHLSNSAENV